MSKGAKLPSAAAAVCSNENSNVHGNCGQQKSVARERTALQLRIEVHPLVDLAVACGEVEGESTEVHDQQARQGQEQHALRRLYFWPVLSQLVVCAGDDRVSLLPSKSHATGTLSSAWLQHHNNLAGYFASPADTSSVRKAGSML